MDNISINGCVKNIIFYNDKNSYCVFGLDYNDELITCVGYIIDLNVGENVKLIGSWSNHEIYGEQFKVDYIEKIIPSTIDGIIKYLSSGVIKGIREKMAKKIVDKFGENTFLVIEKTPEKLSTIRGISLEKAIKIQNDFCKKDLYRKSIMFLQKFDISLTYCKKIYSKYKDELFDIIKNNPYRLADDIVGISFKSADKIALSTGMLPDNPNRIKSAIKYMLKKEAQNGNTYSQKNVLIGIVRKLLEIEIIIIENIIKKLQIENKVHIENINNVDCIYLYMYYNYECYIAKKLIELSGEFNFENENNIDDMIINAEIKNNIKLDEIQKKAVREALINGVLVITGGPGTGKTTIINTIIQILLEEELEVELAAPTGRAAKRLAESTGLDAQTIHRLLGISFDKNGEKKQFYEKNENNPIEADVIIIDEFSMVDINIMFALTKAIVQGTRLILVGDSNQLPSVGAGNVLKDIINSQKLKVVKLNKIFRQAQESAIVMNAHRINQGKMPISNEENTDFFFIKRGSADGILNTLQELILKRIPKFLGYNCIDDIQILSTMRKGSIGVNSINSFLQGILNPPDEGKTEKKFGDVVYRKGDKVMQIKNNYNSVWTKYNSEGKIVEYGKGIFNGDQGVIKEILDDRIMVFFDEDKEVCYEHEQLDELELSYAITIHKSQGSEYPIVIIPLLNIPPQLLSRNLIYTGVTRAKNLVIVIGSKEVLHNIVKSNKEVNRNSALSYRISKIYNEVNGEF